MVPFSLLSIIKHPSFKIVTDADCVNILLPLGNGVLAGPKLNLLCLKH